MHVNINITAETVLTGEDFTVFMRATWA